MKDKKLKVISPGVEFGSNVECPKCGSKNLRRFWSSGFENFHAETNTKEYLRVYCKECEYPIGEEHTKDFVA